ncbi:TPR repeat-containing protein [Marinobacter zhejiangensis]|uniref:TPR repeat-containing protein n=2 Tax=Marinobacter zhejiangensis TaxID=488535 RepID=A0A1I4KXH3_9GAMM|nr:TPR repeat-containing protein [Marinobacter zhejiangensis]
MVSVNPIRNAGLAAVLLLSGCASLSNFAPGLAGSSEDMTEVSAPAVIDTPALAPAAIAEGGAPLPQQSYSITGEKIPYQPAPNPYLSGQAPVPPQAVADFRAAQALLDAEQYRDARIAFRQMTRDYPDLSGPWVKLGEIADKRDYPDKAEEAYRNAVEVNPNNINAYLALALHLRQKGSFAAAQQAYIDVLTLWKDCPPAHLNLAVLYDLYLNRPELAQPHYEAYDFLTGGDNPEVNNWLVEVRRRTGIETSFIDQPPALPEPVEATPVAAEQAAEPAPESSDKG